DVAKDTEVVRRRSRPALLTHASRVVADRGTEIVGHRRRFAARIDLVHAFELSDLRTEIFFLHRELRVKSLLLVVLLRDHIGLRHATESIVLRLQPALELGAQERDIPTEFVVAVGRRATKEPREEGHLGIACVRDTMLDLPRDEPRALALER